MKDKSTGLADIQAMLSQVAAASVPLKQSNSVVKNPVQGKALNELTLAPLYTQNCWAGYEMLLSWQMSHGHCESRPESATSGWSRFDIK